MDEGICEETRCAQSAGTDKLNRLENRGSGAWTALVVTWFVGRVAFRGIDGTLFIELRYVFLTRLLLYRLTNVCVGVADGSFRA